MPLSPVLRQRYLYSGTLLLLLIVCIYRLRVLQMFAWWYTDSDQGVMWMAARDFSRGDFHSLYFYGQSYNVLLESLFAAPLILLGMPVEKALPLITSVMCLLPFFSLGLLVLKYRKSTWGWLILCFPLLLMPQYDLITSVSRGFVNGLALLSPAFLLLFEPRRPLAWLLAALFSGLAALVNPNSLLLALPILLYGLLYNYRSPRFYILQALAFLPALLMYLLKTSYYQNHPEQIIHAFEVSYSLENLQKAWLKVEDYFAPFQFYFWPGAFVLIVFWIILTFILYRRRLFRAFICSCSFPFLIFFPMLASKLQDGSDSVFLPLARMYLALPLLFCMLIAFQKSRSLKLGTFIILGAATLALLKWQSLPGLIDEEINSGKNTVVAVAKVPVLRWECGVIESTAAQYSVNRLLIADHWNQDFYNYACPVLEEGYPQSLLPAKERRYWQWERFRPSEEGRLMLISAAPPRDERWEKIENHHHFYLWKGENFPFNEQNLELLLQAGN